MVKANRVKSVGQLAGWHDTLFPGLHEIPHPLLGSFSPASVVREGFTFRSRDWNESGMAGRGAMLRFSAAQTRVVKAVLVYEQRI